VEAAMMQRPMIQQQQRQQQLQQQHLLHLQEVGGGLPPFNGGSGGFGQPDPAQLMALHQQHELMEQMSIERELKRRETMRKVNNAPEMTLATHSPFFLVTIRQFDDTT
jgi:DNA topoisomerase 2-associated protein PAT1